MCILRDYEGKPGGSHSQYAYACTVHTSSKCFFDSIDRSQSECNEIGLNAADFAGFQINFAKDAIEIEFWFAFRLEYLWMRMNAM